MHPVIEVFLNDAWNGFVSVYQGVTREKAY